MEMKTLTVNGVSYTISDPDSISCTAQTLTEAQRAQARENIGAAAANKLDSMAITKNLLTGAEVVEGAFYNGVEAANAIYRYYKVHLPAGTYTISPNVRYIYNETAKEMLVNQSGVSQDATFTIADTGWCYITVFTIDSCKLFSADHTADEVESIGEYTINEDQIPSIANHEQRISATERNVSGLLKSFTTKNLLEGAELVKDAYNIGTEYANSTYKYYKNVYLSAGEYGTLGRVRFVANADTKLTVFNSGSIENDISFTIAEDGRYHITFVFDDHDPKVFSSVYTAEEVESIGEYTLAPTIHVPNMPDGFAYRNMLTGKKWVACGDSFTYGGNGTLETGLYAGKPKSYPYFVGNRCGMVVVNDGQSGSTMTYLGTQENAFSNLRYQQIPADADYITLKFGINDDTGHQNAPMGTIDDTTNTTFYGAWNVVMEHLITNHPTAHIGIIVTNGSIGGYAEATIAIAKKWGVPYLDMATGEQVPLPIRSNRTDICEDAKDARTNAFRVSETDLHPNAIAHEYESRYIEAWLMTI